MTGLELLADLRARGVELNASGDRLAYDAPAGVLTPETLATLKAHKATLLAALARQPVVQTCQRDEQGRLICFDGTVYAPTATGGWILVKHPTKRMREPGIVEASR